jgi:hypothetical protein
MVRRSAYAQKDLCINAVLEMFTTEELGTKRIEIKEGTCSGDMRNAYRTRQQSESLKGKTAW